MLKKLLFAGVGIILLLTPPIASAQSVSGLQAQVQSLLAQIAAMQGGSPTSCVNLTSTLALGSTGQGVTDLQNYLIAQGDLASGNNTGYYGFATAQAVGQMQLSLGIVSSSGDSAFGIFGPKTRAAVNVCGAAQPIQPNQRSLSVCSGLTGPSVRSTSDQPDDTSGYQVHVLYVLPSDGTDHQYDTNGAIANSVSAWEHWLCGQTGGQGMKLDTHNGQVDITFVRLDASDNTLMTGADLPKTFTVNPSSNPYLRDDIEWHLRQMGLIQPNKLYAVYYDGHSNASCGGGTYPKGGLYGQVAAEYMQGGNPNAPACQTNPLGANASIPGYLDYDIIHEIVHTLGFVPPTAPHFTLQGHVSDSSSDLMYAGSQPWAYANGLVLDYNHDDYYKANIPNSPDLSNSAFLTNGGTEIPTNWGQSSIPVTSSATTPTPTPTITLTDQTTGATGANITVNPGDMVSATWNAGNGVTTGTASTLVTTDSLECGQSSNGPFAWQAPDGSLIGATLSGKTQWATIILPCQAGHVTSFTYTVTLPDGRTYSAKASITFTGTQALAPSQQLSNMASVLEAVESILNKLKGR